MGKSKVQVTDFPVSLVGTASPAGRSPVGFFAWVALASQYAHPSENAGAKRPAGGPIEDPLRPYDSDHLR